MDEEKSGLSSLDLTMFQAVLDKIPNYVESTLAFLAIATVATLAAKGGKSYYNDWQLKKNFNADVLELDTNVVVSSTEYIKTNDINPQTGNLFYRQRISTVGSVDLDELFPKDWSELIAKNMDKAKKQCTRENPCILLHMAEILSDIKDSDEWSDKGSNAVRRLNKEFINGLSEKFNPKSLAGNIAMLNEGEEVEHRRVIPFLLYEPNAEKRQMRLLLVRTSDIFNENIQDLDARDLLFHEGVDAQAKEVWASNPSHPHALRAETIKAVSEMYKENKDLFQVLRLFSDNIVPINHEKYSVSHQPELPYLKPEGVVIEVDSDGEACIHEEGDRNDSFAAPE